jgi:hypothetical protein
MLVAPDWYSLTNNKQDDMPDFGGETAIIRPPYAAACDSSRILFPTPPHCLRLWVGMLQNPLHTGTMY